LKVAVVGAGIHGASVARNLSERGHALTIFDQYPAGHRMGSSHGRSRIVRKAYPDSFYTAIMAEAYPLWRELEQSSGCELLREVGLLYFGHRDSENLKEMLKGLNALKVPNEVLSPKESAQRFSELSLQEGEIGVFTPEAGWVDADAAVAQTLRLAASAGCEFVQKRVSPSDLTEFDRVAVCPGAWVGEWMPEAPVKVTLQTVAYLRGTHRGPVWIEDGPDFLYGFPSDGVQFKVAAHRQGPELSPNEDDRIAREEDLRLIEDVARRRFGIDSPVVQETVGCLYTNTPSEDFLFRQSNEKTFVISACSGHGFKFGPWIGRVVADLVEGRRTLDQFLRFVA
jgi:sarcosine oxidase